MYKERQEENTIHIRKTSASRWQIIRGMEQMWGQLLKDSLCVAEHVVFKTCLSSLLTDNFLRLPWSACPRTTFHSSSNISHLSPKNSLMPSSVSSVNKDKACHTWMWRRRKRKYPRQSAVLDLWWVSLPSIALSFLPAAFQHNKHSNTSIIFLLGELCARGSTECGGRQLKRLRCWQHGVMKHPPLLVVTNHFVLWGSRGLLKRDGAFCCVNKFSRLNLLEIENIDRGRWPFSPQQYIC